MKKIIFTILLCLYFFGGFGIDSTLAVEMGECGVSTNAPGCGGDDSDT